MKFGYLLLGLGVLAGCQSDPAPDAAPVATAASVPADWCVSVGPDGTALVLSEISIVPAASVTPAQLAATPPCTPSAPAEPL